MAAGSKVLGFSLGLDDLKVVEGIGPRIEELCQEAGITTWRQLAATPVDRLAEILTEAGPRFRVHEPETWPTQARLLAEGQWEEFAALTERLTGGRA